MAVSLTKEDLQAIGALIEQKIAPMNARFDKLEQGQAVLADRLDGLEQGQAVLADKLDGLEQGQAVLANRLDGLEQGQAATAVRLDAFKGELIEIKGLIQGSQQVIVEVVDLVDQKTGRIEKAIQDMQGATAQNAYELQVLKSKAQ